MKRKIAAILAADVAGYSRLVAEDEEETLRRLASYREVFDSHIARAHGRIFNTAGDSVMAEFPSAVDAVRCSLDVQESFRTRNLSYPASRQMNFRIGVTIGDVVEREGDLLGDGVNIAARLQGVAPEGGVCISRSVYEAVFNKLTVSFVDRGPQKLKNIPEPVHVYVVTPERQAGAHEEGKTPVSALNAGAVLLLAAGGLGLWFAQPKSVEPQVAVAPKKTSGSVASGTASVKAEPQPASPSNTANVQVDPASPAAAPASPDTSNIAEPSVTKSEPSSIDPGLERHLAQQLRACLDEPLASAVVPCRGVVERGILSGEDKARVELKFGRALRAAGDAVGAVTVLSRVIDADPNADAYIHRGIAHLDQLLWDAAIADFTEAIRLDANNGEAFNNRAWTYYRSNRPQDALPDANRAVSLLPGKAYVWDTRAHILEAIGKKTESLKDYKKALALDPEMSSSREGVDRLAATGP